ncbi:MAG: hypothetical protein ACRDSS_05755 [Actinocrinis sp.]
MRPEFVVPASVPVDLVLLRTEDVAVTIGLLRAYATGFEFTVDSRSRHAAQGHRLGMINHYVPGSTDTGDDLRLGLEFSDGRRAVLDEHGYPHSAESDPNAVVVMPGGGGGSDRSWSSRYWIHPLPSPGRLSFVATWPAFGVTEARVDVEADAILAASSRALELWPEAPGPALGGSTFGVVTAGRPDRDDD